MRLLSSYVAKEFSAKLKNSFTNHGAKACACRCTQNENNVKRVEFGTVAIKYTCSQLDDEIRCLS